MALVLVGHIIINKNKNKIKICFRKTHGDPAVKKTDTIHRQRARQDTIPAYFTQSMPQRLNSFSDCFQGKCWLNSLPKYIPIVASI